MFFLRKTKSEIFSYSLKKTELLPSQVQDTLPKNCFLTDYTGHLRWTNDIHIEILLLAAEEHEKRMNELRAQYLDDNATDGSGPGTPGNYRLFNIIII